MVLLFLKTGKSGGDEGLGDGAGNSGLSSREYTDVGLRGQHETRDLHVRALSL